jgi:hypothetical protein
MYELFACKNNPGQFDHYLAHYMLTPVKDVASFYQKYKADANYEKGIGKLDSINRFMLKVVLDTLNKYQIERNHQTFEYFTWLYESYRDVSFAHHNEYSFQKGNRVFKVEFGTMERIEGQWRLTSPVLLTTRIDTTTLRKITPFASIPVDPVAMGQQLAKNLQSGDLAAFNKSFITRQILASNYVKNEEELEYVETDINNVKQRVADRINRMIPGAFTVALESFHWERLSRRKNDMDKGTYEFVIRYEDSEIHATVKFSVLESGVWLYSWKEEVRN